MDCRFLPDYLLPDNSGLGLLRPLKNSLSGRGCPSQCSHLSCSKYQLASLNHRVWTQQDPAVALHQHLTLWGLDQLTTEHLWARCTGRSSWTNWWSSLRRLCCCWRKWRPHGRTGYTFHHLRNLRQNSGLYTWKNLLASLDGVWNTFDDLRGLLNALLRYLSNI